MNLPSYVIRPMAADEMDRVATFIARGYFSDKFFHWVVPDGGDRQKVVSDYYKAYISYPRAVVHVAETPMKNIIGATVWLPHDTDPDLYQQIAAVTGKYAPQFNAVADKSHYSEPTGTPFYQLVGFVVDEAFQGRSVGTALLKHQLDVLDAAGIPTYLEASTAYFGTGVYSRFNYQPVGEIMTFGEDVGVDARLYPLWRPVNAVSLDRASLVEQNYEFEDEAPVLQRVTFGKYTWDVIEEEQDKHMLLLNGIIPGEQYHDTFEPVMWKHSYARKFLNSCWINHFTPAEQAQIVAVEQTADSMYFIADAGMEAIEDKIFLPSLAQIFEAYGWVGDSRNLMPEDIFCLHDGFSANRVIRDVDGVAYRYPLIDQANRGDMITTVAADGRICITGDFVNRGSTPISKLGLRPAMWVKK